MQVFSTLSAIVFTFYLVFDSGNAAFTTTTTLNNVAVPGAISSSSRSSSQSYLFRSNLAPSSSTSLPSPMMIKKLKLNQALVPPPPTPTTHKMTTNDDEEEEVKTEAVEDKSTSKEKAKGGAFNSNKNGFLTALFLAPPLIAKFGIVILVKIVTDLVVFPLLFLYRLCQTIKAKVVGFVKPNDFKGDNINGAT